MQETLLRRDRGDDPSVGQQDRLAQLEIPVAQREPSALEGSECKIGALEELHHDLGIGRLLARHQSGEIDATDRIWRLINLQVWGESVLGGRDMSDGLLHSTQKACIAS